MKCPRFEHHSKINFWEFGDTLQMAVCGTSAQYIVCVYVCAPHEYIPFIISSVDVPISISSATFSSVYPSNLLL